MGVSFEDIVGIESAGFGTLKAASIAAPGLVVATPSLRPPPSPPIAASCGGLQTLAFCAA
jgi:hypothetical protein